MSKKYKFKKRRKSLNPYIVFAMFAICLIFVSTGYALLSDTLTINGKATFLDSSGGSDYELGDSTYTYSVLSTWANASGGITYQIEIDYLNLDGEINGWELKFDLPDGFLVTSNIWQSSSVSLSGNTVTLKDNGWNAGIPNNEITKFNFILDFDRADIDFYFKNLIVNGKLATCTDEEV